MFNKKHSRIVVVASLLGSVFVLPQEGKGMDYKINISKDIPIIDGIHFKQGTSADPGGNTLTLNNQYLKFNDKPYFPIMGEFHYNRYPKAEWEEAVLKMKASGIQMIAFYCFWHLHEEKEGDINFSQNKDVRAFIELCGKHGLYAFPRIGPWSHGEARYGGYPDWFADKLGKEFGVWGSFAPGQHISDDFWPFYERWYKALTVQFDGLYFKDGGPIIGLQFDNEVTSKGAGSPGYEYLKALKNLAVKYGMDVPIYSATGWTGPVDADEMISTFGAYPDAPWEGHSNPIVSPANYSFTHKRSDEKIGSDLFKANVDYNAATNLVFRHPYITAELGGGNQITYHRRVEFVAEDLLAMMYCRLGAGSNGNGYYVYHGTQHPLSGDLDHPTQESKASGYNLDYPMISYDFLAPITEWGFIRDYYHDFKMLHLFLDEFGAGLTAQNSFLPKNRPLAKDDVSTLRYAVRSRNNSGYIFFNTYCRNLEFNKQEGVRFELEFKDKAIHVPDTPITIESGVYGVFPFNLNLADITLRYGMAHPLTKIEVDGGLHYFFYAQKGIAPEYRFDESTVDQIEISKGEKTNRNGSIKVGSLSPGFDSVISLKSNADKEIFIHTITFEQARSAYRFKLGDKAVLVFSSDLVFQNAFTGRLTFRSLNSSNIKFKTFPKVNLEGKFLGTPGSSSEMYSDYAAGQPEWKAKEIMAKDISNVGKIDAYVDSLSENPSGPTYSHIFDPEKPFRIYELDIPTNMIPDGISNVLVNFNYAGNTAQVYADGVLIADDYYSGGPMPFGLNRHKGKIGKSSFKFQITPMLPKYDIYFEPDTDLAFSSKYNAILKRIELLPEYEFRFKMK